MLASPAHNLDGCPPPPFCRLKLPEKLRQKARAIFFAKQKGAGFHVKTEPLNKEGASQVAGGSKGVCYAFLRGDCDRGDACIFRHATATEADSAKMENWKKWVMFFLSQGFSPLRFLIPPPRFLPPEGEVYWSENRRVEQPPCGLLHMHTERERNSLDSPLGKDREGLQGDVNQRLID